MSNHLLRVMTSRGVQHVSGLDPWERSTVASHWNAVRDFLENGDDHSLRSLEAELLRSADGVVVGDVELSFNLDLIEREAFRGETRFEELYES